MSGNLRFSTGFREAFENAGGQNGEPEGLQAGFRASSEPQQRAFAPDEVKVGSIVYGRLKPLLGADYTKNDDFRPLLVTGLWRYGDDIEKIEMMSFSYAAPRKMYPCLFPYTLPHLRWSSRKTLLNTSSLYMLENKAGLFSKRTNQKIASVEEEIWPGIVASRASAIIFNPNTRFMGACDFSLEREGFVFESIPFSAVRSLAFIPEVQTQAHLSRPVNILPKEKLSEIVSFAVSYTEHMKQQNGHAFFTFPEVADWPRDIPSMDFPRWATRPAREGGLSPQLP